MLLINIIMKKRAINFNSGTTGSISLFSSRLASLRHATDVDCTVD